jgi:hypothetical protein
MNMSRPEALRIACTLLAVHVELVPEQQVGLPVTECGPKVSCA